VSMPCPPPDWVIATLRAACRASLRSSIVFPGLAPPCSLLPINHLLFVQLLQVLRSRWVRLVNTHPTSFSIQYEGMMSTSFDPPSILKTRRSAERQFDPRRVRKRVRVHDYACKTGFVVHATSIKQYPTIPNLRSPPPA